MVGSTSTGVAMSVRLDKAFNGTLIPYAKSLSVNPEWFLRIFYLESGLDPSADNGSYVGLNQLVKSYLTNRRIDVNDYKTWPASKQLQEVIGPWYKEMLRGRKPPTVGALYAYNLAPSTMAASDLAPDTVVLTGNNYEQNKALRKFRDSGPDAILISDLDTFLTHKATEAPYVAAKASLVKDEGITARIPKLVWLAPLAVVIAIFVAVLKGIKR